MALGGIASPPGLEVRRCFANGNRVKVGFAESTIEIQSASNRLAWQTMAKRDEDKSAILLVDASQMAKTSPVTMISPC